MKLFALRGSYWEAGVEGLDLRPTWTLKVCRIIAFMAIFVGLGLLFYIPLGFRYTLNPKGFGSRVSPKPSLHVRALPDPIDLKPFPT